MHRAADTRHKYIIQSHYPDTAPTSPVYYLSMRDDELDNKRNSFRMPDRCSDQEAPK